MKIKKISRTLTALVFAFFVFTLSSAAIETDALIYLSSDSIFSFNCIYGYDANGKTETVKYLVNVPPQTTVSELNEDIISSAPLAFTDSLGAVLSGGDCVGTGTVVSNGTDEARVIIYGDCNGNGVINVTDYLRIKHHCAGLLLLEGEELIAADIDGTGTADIRDLVRLKSVFKEVIPRDESEKKLTIKMIDVGQADCFIMTLPEGRTVLTDTGRTASESKSAVASALASVDNDIDIMILTHPDSDHIGYARELLDMCDIGFIYRPDYVHTSMLYQELEAALQSGDVPYRAPNITYTESGVLTETVELGGAEILFLSPGCSPSGYTGKGQTNENSIVFRLKYGERTFMFTGDMCECNENDLLDAEYITADGKAVTDALECDFLKIAHHGAETATSQNFLDALTPKYALISAGDNKTYDHPKQVTLDKLEAMGIVYYVSRYDGAYTVECTGVHIYMYPTHLRK